MNRLNYIYSIAVVLLIVMSSCNQDMNQFHEEWLKDGEINYVGKVDSLIALGGDERIEFHYYLSDRRAKFLTVNWLELGVDREVRVPIEKQESEEKFSFIIGENESILENDYTFTLVTDDDNGTKSIPFKTIGKVYGENYRKSLNNRLVTGFEVTDEGINLEFSSALNEDDQGIELTYNNGSENFVLTFGADELVEKIFLSNPDFSTPISYSTIYRPNNSIDTFKAEEIVPAIEKLENVALNKPVIASSSLNDTYVAEKAVDGIIGVNESRWINAREVGSHWIEIDLEGEVDINRVRVHDDSPISNFVLEYEIDGEWNVLEEVTGNNQKVFTGDYTGINATKIRYVFETFDADPNEIIRMFELEVFVMVKLQ
ncbi:DUF4998 domain-containing protein [Maribacter ulvicola]|uniref:F5/8 type C domain-containing protein n=1 Tax=Maribacter ulvicola TaxID=228959 RepID=A0A1N6ZXZ9_9FLAO|nr:DUF4998 domain-containing protein [Maribacter ulvicola]SIR31619.1 F5/8 type C domain-containing protein [Maribacter ulvicola]